MHAWHATTTPPNRLYPAVEHELMLLLTTASAALLLLNPVASLALSGALLINLPATTPRHVRIGLALVAAFSLSLMAGARPLDDAGSNDIDGYYIIYESLAAGDLSELTHFGAGFEIALPLLMYLWSLVLPSLSIHGLMFCLAATSAMLVLLWVELTFYGRRRGLRPELLGICILMLNLYFSTQLVRQYLSLIMLLYAFTASGRTRQVLYLAVAASFHLSALPFFAVYLLARRGPLGWLVIIAAALVFRLYFTQLLVAFDVLPPAVAEKLLYYVDNDDDSSAADIGSLRMIVLLGAISIAVGVASMFRPTPAARPWLAVPWVTGIVHLLLLAIPLASLRATLMVHSVAPGLIAHRMLSGRGRLLVVAVLNVLLLYKLGSYATAEQGVNLRLSLAMFAGFLN